jgi:hypothetical protein
MSGPDSENQLTIQIGPFNNPDQVVTSIDFVVHFDNNTWNNNNGADFHIPINNSPTGIDDPSLQQRISLWPVPANEKVYIGVPVELSSRCRLLLVSITGTILKEYAIEKENFSLDISDLNPGIYFIRILNTEGNLQATRKIVVQ